MAHFSLWIYQFAFSQLHEETCPDRVIVEMFLMDKPATNYNSPADSGFSGSNLGSTVDDGEDWDNCVSYKTFLFDRQPWIL